MSLSTQLDAAPAQDSGVACVISAIAPDEREGHMALAKNLLFAAFQERHQISNGYAWQFTAEQYDDLTRYVANDRLCCPFTYTLQVTPHAGPIWLHITGSDAAVHAFLQSEIDALEAEINGSPKVSTGTATPSPPRESLRVVGSSAESGIACDLSAIPQEQREAHFARAERLMFTGYQERQVLPDGFAWRLTADDYDDIYAYIANEHRCCPFFTFTVEVSPHRGPIWLRITGDPSVAAFLQAEVASHDAAA